ncbi:MAG: ribonuclease III [Clostridia bacterium]|nr:ribonuclease III [Clostridia bacterium]
MDRDRARRLNSLQLAHVGDTVWDLLVRSRLIYQGRNVRNMHKDAIACVNAGAQAVAMQRMLPTLSEEEADVARRGRNAHPHHAAPKNQDVVDYHQATALEALVGYLYLTGQEERLLELFRLSQEETTCPVQK